MVADEKFDEFYFGGFGRIDLVFFIIIGKKMHDVIGVEGGEHLRRNSLFGQCHSEFVFVVFEIWELAVYFPIGE